MHTDHGPGGASRDDSRRHVLFGLECALDELAVKLDLDPFELRRRNVVVPAHQCLDQAESALASPDDVPMPAGGEWRVGEGMALSATGTSLPRSLALDVHAVRVAVHRGAGELRVLRLVNAAGLRTGAPCGAALANAVRRAVGVRPHQLPLAPDRIWKLLHGRLFQPPCRFPRPTWETGT